MGYLDLKEEKEIVLYHCMSALYADFSFQTFAAEQEVAHVVAEGTADVAAAVGQSAGQAAAVEGSKGVGAAAAGEGQFKLRGNVPTSAGEKDFTCTNVSALDRPLCSGNICTERTAHESRPREEGEDLTFVPCRLTSVGCPHYRPGPA